MSKAIGMKKQKEEIVKAILEYDKKVHKKVESPTVDFAGKGFARKKEPNKFLLSNPNAFLFGVIFDQGIPAERAWSAPFLLKQRLGHFDLKKMVKLGPEGLGKIIMQKPALHRYFYLGEWIFAAAKKLLEEYKGNASNVWEDGLLAKEMVRRLEEFKGIGQKKANMTVRILNRVFGVRFKKMEAVDIPYDVHIRRVLLRLGLAKKDTVESITQAARDLYPKNPSRLDSALWHIGRNFCHPRNPECLLCPLAKFCPKLVYKLPAS